MNDSNRAIAYLQKAKDNLADAQILLAANRAEGTCNRAYYALFDGILALLFTTNGPLPKTHTGAHTEFRKQFIQTGLFARTTSNTITELFNLRQGSDYEIDFDISVEDAQDAVEKSTEFLIHVDAYLRDNGFTL
ncbi:HEPN domain-containing protein [Spirosoma daeguense]